MFEDGTEMVCVRRTDGEVARISASQAVALMFSADMKPLAEHVAVLSERDIGHFVQGVARRFHMSASTGQRFANTLKQWREEGTLKSYGRLSAKRMRELVELRAKGLRPPTANCSQNWRVGRQSQIPRLPFVISPSRLPTGQSG